MGDELWEWKIPSSGIEVENMSVGKRDMGGKIE